MQSPRTKRCRLCLENCTQYIEIFKDDFPKMIYLLTRIKVSHRDDFPKVSCMPCALEVKNAVYARKKIILSHKKLVAEAETNSHNIDDTDHTSDFNAPVEPNDNHSVFDPLNTEISLKLIPKTARVVIVEDENVETMQPVTEVFLPEIPIDNNADNATTTLEIAGDLKEEQPEIIDITEISNLLNLNNKADFEEKVKNENAEDIEKSNDKGLKIKFINKKQLMTELVKSGKSCKYCGKTFHRSSLRRHELRHEQLGNQAATLQSSSNKRITRSSNGQRPQNTELRKPKPEQNLKTCHLCGKTYHKSSLSRHIRDTHHTSAADAKSFVLDEAVDALLGQQRKKSSRIYKQEESSKNGFDFDQYLSKYNAHKKLQETLKIDIDQAKGIEEFIKNHNAPKDAEHETNFLDYVDKNTNEVHKAVEPASSDYPGDPKTKSCKICNITFAHRNQYQNHISKHKVKMCDVCNKEVRTCYMKRHMMAHETEPTACEECNITYKNKLSFHMHNVLYHENRYSCVCEDCGLSFKTRSKLMIHKRKVHIKEKNVKCETCGKLFFSRVHLKNHIKMKHLKIRSHMCQFCGKGYSSKFALTTHLRQHTNEAPHKCTFCGDSFRQKVSLRNHLKSKHKIKEEENCFCDKCGKGFTTLGAVEVHSRVHEGIKCPHCTDTFADFSYLQQHVASQHPEESKIDVGDEYDESEEEY
ncbi:zinc finger protein 91-like [Anthonomus grandis grandis]|uniref:zinc finger protein 91-like n=1 Tax=Anthonomus grandis grandis TaxID=2921223 RepID=UPI002166369A|nr:zinc finger protein 91-like [Anthonomus grandis grandis]